MEELILNLLGAINWQQKEDWDCLRLQRNQLKACSGMSERYANTLTISTQ